MSPCEVCKGACCETLVIPIRFADNEAQRWLEFHGERTPGGMRFECKCEHLIHGKCGIYGNRPKVCRDYAVGSNACLDAITKRRPHKAAKILSLMEAGHGEETSG